MCVHTSPCIICTSRSKCVWWGGVKMPKAYSWATQREKERTRSLWGDHGQTICVHETNTYIWIHGLYRGMWIGCMYILVVGLCKTRRAWCERRILCGPVQVSGGAFQFAVNLFHSRIRFVSKALLVLRLCSVYTVCVASFNWRKNNFVFY